MKKNKQGKKLKTPVGCGKAVLGVSSLLTGLPSEQRHRPQAVKNATVTESGDWIKEKGSR